MWNCAACGETTDVDDDLICWSCGRDRTTSAGSKPTAQPRRAATVVAVAAEAEPVARPTNFLLLPAIGLVFLQPVESIGCAVVALVAVHGGLASRIALLTAWLTIVTMSLRAPIGLAIGIGLMRRRRWAPAAVTWWLAINAMLVGAIALLTLRLEYEHGGSTRVDVGDVAVSWTVCALWIWHIRSTPGMRDAFVQ